MASAGVRKELECSICLSIFTDPVTLRCGHNYCRFCIKQFLDTQNKFGVYSCPQCRAKFRKRPALQKNINLHNVVERLLSAQSKQVTGIFCTYCIHAPVPAVKSCLHCEASLCDNHLRVHNKAAEHVLTEPGTSLENRKCPVHKEILKFYCTKDDICICVSCSLAGEHRGHQIEMLDEAAKKKKENLKEVLHKSITKREETEKNFQNLVEHRRKAQEKAAGEEEKVTALFIDIRRRLDILEKRVQSEISRQKYQVSSLSGVIQKLEIKKDELSVKIRHIEELCNMTDPLTVLQKPNTGDLCDPETGGGDEDTGGHNKIYDIDVDVITGMLHAGFSDIMTCLQTISPAKHPKNCPCHHKVGSPTSDPQALHLSVGGKVMASDKWGMYGEGPADILLDVNTAANNILISDDLKNATSTDIKHNLTETAESFQDYQVISGSRFSSGRHYWNMEIRNSVLWRVGICYPSMDRRGQQSHIGDNNKSWSLCRELWCNNQYSVRHDGKVIRLPHPISSNRVRICLDYEAGQLSFYELGAPIRHLHTVTATFTEPLHAALYVCGGCIKIPGGAAAVRNHHHNFCNHCKTQHP